MHSKNSFRVLTRAYSLARSAGVLQTSWGKRAFVSSYFLYKRFCEDPFRALVHRRPFLFQGGDILDVGANIGYTSCLFARALDPGFKVYSFEPDRTNFQLFREVIQREKLTQWISPVNVAVGNSDGHVELWHNGEHSGDHRVATSQFKSTLPASSEIFSVPLVSVDSFVKAHELRSISFIKIDVQGYEVAVCEGMLQTLSNFPNLSVCCEYSLKSLVELGYAPARLLNYFRSNGFHIHTLTRSSIQLTPDDATIQKAAEECGYLDLLCSRQALS